MRFLERDSSTANSATVGYATSKIFQDQKDRWEQYAILGVKTKYTPYNNVYQGSVDNTGAGTGIA